MAETVEIGTTEAGDERRDNVTSAGLEPSTWRRLEQYREDREITSRSEATRRVIRAGLDEIYPQDSGVSVLDQLITGAAVVLLLGYPVAAATTGETATAWGYIGVLAVLAFLQPWLSSAWNRAKDALPSGLFS